MNLSATGHINLKKSTKLLYGQTAKAQNVAILLMIRGDLWDDRERVLSFPQLSWGLVRTSNYIRSVHQAESKDYLLCEVVSISSAGRRHRHSFTRRWLTFLIGPWKAEQTLTLTSLKAFHEEALDYRRWYNKISNILLVIYFFFLAAEIRQFS